MGKTCVPDPGGCDRSRTPNQNKSRKNSLIYVRDIIPSFARRFLSPRRSSLSQKPFPKGFRNRLIRSLFRFHLTHQFILFVSRAMDARKRGRPEAKANGGAKKFKPGWFFSFQLHSIC